MGESAFTGVAGRTGTAETTIWCPACGTWFGGRWYVGVDAEADPGLLATLLDHGFAGLNGCACPACEARYVIEEPLVVHRADAEQLLLVVPRRRLHRAQQARARLIVAVAESPGVAPPAYAREPLLVAGVAGLRAILGDATRVSAHPASPAPVEVPDEAARSSKTVEVEPIVEPAAPEGTTLAGAPEPEAPRDVSSAPPDAAPLGEAGLPPDADDPPHDDDPELDALPPTGLLAALIETAGDSAEGAPDDSADDGAGGAWHDAWSLDGAGEGVEHEPTRISRVAAPRAHLPPGHDRRLLVEDGDVLALCRVSSAGAADRLLVDEGELRFQLHVTPAGPALALTLVPPDGAPLCWPVDPEAHADVLDRLARRFAVTIEAVDGEGALVGRRAFDPPLARNVARARARVEQLSGATAAAREALLDGDVDLVGQLRHNFHEDSFADCRSAAEALLGLGIVGFWTEPERESYLLDVQSFPRVWFDAIVRRVLVAALEFGLMPPPHLEARAIELGLVADPRSLVSRALASFAELNLSVSLKRNDLDPLDNYENWERLLTRAEALGLAVDSGLRGLALGAMEAARRAVEVADASEEAIELDLDDAIELESIDELDPAAPAGPEEVTEPLTDLIDAALLGLLDDAGQRAAAAAVLLQRGESLYAPTLADALMAMNAVELIRVLPLGLPLADAMAAHLVPALRSPDPVLRRAIALFLAEARRPEVTLALVDELLDARDAGWGPLASALAGFGGELRHLVAGLPLDGDAFERVARVLAELPPAAREAVYDVDARRSPRVERCLLRAAELAEAGGPSSFGARLSEALSSLVGGDARAVSAGGDGGREIQ